jgi:hypothetical protein
MGLFVPLFVVRSLATECDLQQLWKPGLHVLGARLVGLLVVFPMTRSVPRHVHGLVGC